jgi:hypothetical protein
MVFGYAHKKLIEGNLENLFGQKFPTGVSFNLKPPQTLYLF